VDETREPCKAAPTARHLNQPCMVGAIRGLLTPLFLPSSFPVKFPFATPSVCLRISWDAAAAASAMVETEQTLGPKDGLSGSHCLCRERAASAWERRGGAFPTIQPSGPGQARIVVGGQRRLVSGPVKLDGRKGEEEKGGGCGGWFGIAPGKRREGMTQRG
jgi:hypothetical protein